MDRKYSLDIFKDCDFEVSWNTIKVGYDLDRLTSEEIGKFAMQFLEMHPSLVNEYVSELILGIKEEDLDIYLQRLFDSLNLTIPKENSYMWNMEWYKWRYCIIYKMLQHITDEEKLLESVEGLYSDFGYPEDMSPFIYYMPLEENNIPTDSRIARSRLVSNLKKFLAKEKERLVSTKKFEFLPNRAHFAK